MDSYTRQCFFDEPDLKNRIGKSQKLFKKLYLDKEDLIVRSPGRAEIIGNHTDYNSGFALSCCISRSIIALFKKRNDRIIRVFSTGFSKAPLEFLITGSITRDLNNLWINYAKGVVQKLIIEFGQKRLIGADILLDSNIPIGSGVSSSAAYELALAHGLTHISKLKIDRMKTALFCKKAENDFVGSPCGFLDQGTITFGKHNKLVFMDFLPKADAPVSNVKTISIDLNRMDGEFIIAVDKEAKHDLGSSGYPVRRKMCFDSLPFWQKELKREIKSLREVTAEDFEKHKDSLEKINPIMRKRAEHVVFENQRVLEAKEALKKGNTIKFGSLLTESGESALGLYELDEKTPELTFLYNFGKNLPGVIGIRNMGGGFSATILALIEKKKSFGFTASLQKAYKEKFGGKIEFIKFNITSGIGEIKR